MKKMLTILLTVLCCFCILGCGGADGGITSIDNNNFTEIEVDPFAGFNVTVEETKNTKFIFTLAEKKIIKNDTDNSLIIKNELTKDEKVLSYTFLTLDAGTYSVQFRYTQNEDTYIKFINVPYSEINMALDTKYDIPLKSSFIGKFTITSSGFYQFSDTYRSNSFKIYSMNKILEKYNSNFLDISGCKVIFLNEGDYYITLNSYLEFFNGTFWNYSTGPICIKNIAVSDKGSVLLGKEVYVGVSSSISKYTLTLTSDKTVTIYYTPIFSTDKQGDGLFIEDLSNNQIQFTPNNISGTYENRIYTVNLKAGTYNIYESVPGRIAYLTIGTK